MSLQHIQKNSPRLLPKPAKFEKNPPNGYRVIRKTKCGAGGAGSSPIHKQASLAGRLMKRKQVILIQQLQSKLNINEHIIINHNYRFHPKIKKLSILIHLNSPKFPSLTPKSRKLCIIKRRFYLSALKYLQHPHAGHQDFGFDPNSSKPKSQKKLPITYDI